MAEGALMSLNKRQKLKDMLLQFIVKILIGYALYISPSRYESYRTCVGIPVL